MRRKKKNEIRKRDREGKTDRQTERKRKLGASVYSLYCIYLLLCYFVSLFCNV